MFTLILSRHVNIIVKNKTGLLEATAVTVFSLPWLLPYQYRRYPELWHYYPMIFCLTNLAFMVQFGVTREVLLCTT